MRALNGRLGLGSDGEERGGSAAAALGAGAVLAASTLAGAVRRLTRRSAGTDPLRNRVALVTGGSRGLGFLLAERLLRAGCRVAICARSSEDLERARERLSRKPGGTVMVWTCDVADGPAVKEMVRAVENVLGPLEILINNAATIQVAPLESLDPHDFRRALDVDFMGMVHTTLAALPGMRARSGGRIANVTSIGGRVAVPHLLPYDCAKFASVGFSEGLRSSVARDGIKVTTVVPGLMRTGSPVRVEYRGQPEKEYAWFTLGDLLPFTAMSAEAAADRIVQAIRRGEAEVVLSWQAKLLRLVHDLAPAFTSRMLGAVNRLLPEPDGGGGDGRSARGTELRGTLPGWAEEALDRAADRSNQGAAPWRRREEADPY